MYILHVLSIKLRYKLYFSFSVPTPGFPHFYYMLGANLGLLLYGEVSVMRQSNFMSVNQPFHLRSKFHFSEVHGSMNATGHVQSK